MKKVNKESLNPSSFDAWLVLDYLTACNKLPVCEMVGIVTLNSIQESPFLATVSSYTFLIQKKQDSWSSLFKLT